MAKAKVGDIIKLREDGEELLVTSVGITTRNVRAEGIIYSDDAYDVVWSPRPDVPKQPTDSGLRKAAERIYESAFKVSMAASPEAGGKHVVPADLLGALDSDIDDLREALSLARKAEGGA